jgi:hypothetical protein
MKYLFAEDALSGKSATATANIGGRVRTLFEIRNFTATMNKEKVAFNSLGAPGTQHKATGWNGTGNITYYNTTSEWNKLLKDYVKTGRDVYFTINVTNVGQRVGSQTVSLFRCNMNGGDIAKFDVDSTFLDVSTAFTFEDWDMPEEFLDYEEVIGDAQ